MAKKRGRDGSVVMTVCNIFFSMISGKKAKEKKKLIQENNSASKNKPELVKLLDENEARNSDVNPDNLYDAIADAIIRNIIHNDKRSSDMDMGVKNIENLLAEAELNYKRKEEDDIHKNRMQIKERLKQEDYCGKLLIEDQEKQEKSSSKKKSK